MSALREIERGDNAVHQMLGWLEEAGLPTSDVWEDNSTHFAFGDPPAGFAGVVRDGKVVRLRSVVVDPARRGTGLGARMLHALLAQLRGDDIWLLTNSAEAFFARHGFSRMDRSTAPDLVASSRQFTELCPSSAALMHRRA